MVWISVELRYFTGLFRAAFHAGASGRRPRICYHCPLVTLPDRCTAFAMPTRTLRSWILMFALACAASASLPVSAAEASLRRWPAKMAVPPLKLVDLEGREWTSESLRGKVVLLNFWASWCAPCVDELAYLKDLAGGSDFGNEKPVIIGINFKESASRVRAFVSEHKLDYPILLDKNGESFKRWADGILPTTILIDRRGKPRWRIVGELDRKDSSLKNALQAMLAEV
jgi:thiol-disulfide isomerase/thioredoxin